MGDRTPNMSIYKPSPGESVYDPSFSSGLDYIDAHDHSGAPTKGVQIGTNGIEDGAITPPKLSEEIYIEATVQTTDNTPTTADTIEIAQSQAITVTGRWVSLKDDTSESSHGTFLAGFRRATSSNVVSVSTPVINVIDDSSGSPFFAFAVDTGLNEIYIQAVGETAKTINWRIIYNVLRYPDP